MKGYASSLPVAPVTQTIAYLGGIQIQGTLTRYGDMVFFMVNGVIGAAGTYDQDGFGYINAGFCPKNETIAVGNMTAEGSRSGCFNLCIKTTGQILGSMPAIAELTRVQVHGAWITNDA